MAVSSGLATPGRRKPTPCAVIRGHGYHPSVDLGVGVGRVLGARPPTWLQPSAGQERLEDRYHLALSERCVHLLSRIDEDRKRYDALLVLSY